VTDIGEHLKVIGRQIDARLPKLLDTVCDDGILKDAMRYSLLSGGKRLRPALCMMTADLFGDSSPVLDIACAMEMIHAYSLIHDDLPAMDNDELRRGKPTNHVVFGEAYAILSGDGLLNSAFEVMLRCAQHNRDKHLDYLGALNMIAAAAGTKGMIAGQVADMEFERQAANADALEYIHQRKTGALIKASVMAPAVLYRADEEKMGALKTYGQCIGLVFQIVDDILDAEGDQTQVGKTLGKDADADKQTFVRVYGVEASKRIARQKTDEAISALAIFGTRGQRHSQLAAYLLDRQK